jgi:hypothetical protein
MKRLNHKKNIIYVQKSVRSVTLALYWIKVLYSIMLDCYVQIFGLSFYLPKYIVCLHYYVQSHKFPYVFTWSVLFCPILAKYGMCRQMVLNILNITVHKNSFTWSSAVAYGQTWEGCTAFLTWFAKFALNYQTLLKNIDKINYSRQHVLTSMK